MKKIGIIVFAVTLVIGLVISNIFSLGHAATKLFDVPFSLGRVKGSGNIRPEKRQLVDFRGVDVGGAFIVEITAQKDFAVEVDADDNLLSLIRTEVDDGVLKIQTSGRLSPSTPILVRISAPDVSNLEVAGAAHVTLDDLNNPALTVDSSGAAKVKLKGKTAQLNVEASGAAKIDADGLMTDNATIDASGASRVDVNVIGVLRTDASGASKIVYSGDPAGVEKQTSGASSVIRK